MQIMKECREKKKKKEKKNFDLLKKRSHTDNEESVKSLMHIECHQNVIKVKGKQLKLPQDGKKKVTTTTTKKSVISFIYSLLYKLRGGENEEIEMRIMQPKTSKLFNF